MKKYEFDINTGITAKEQEYCGSDYYFITYPSFGYFDIKRIFPNEKGDDIEIHTFALASEVVMRTSWWPVEAFNDFMKRVKESGIDVDTVFSGLKPPLTSYILDDVIDEAKTYKKTIERLREIRPEVPIRFNQLIFCGRDAQSLPMKNVYYSPYDRFEKYLEPPKRIKDMEAERKIREAIDQLGIEKCKELILDNT